MVISTCGKPTSALAADYLDRKVDRMPYILLVIVLIVFAAMAVQSSMQSYATAEQAEAQIATAHVAQINAWGNLIIILVLLLLIVALLAFIIWMLQRGRRATRGGQTPIQRPRVTEDGQPQVSISELTQLATLKILMSLMPKDEQSTATTKQSEDAPDFLHWLR